MVLYFVSSIPTLPLSIYQTFVLEEKHGFNKTTPSLFVIDLLKGWALGFVLGSPFLAAFLYVFKWAGDRFVPWLMAFLCVFGSHLIALRADILQAYLPAHHGYYLPNDHSAALQQAISLSQKVTLRNRDWSVGFEAEVSASNTYMRLTGSKRSSHSNAYFFGLPWVMHLLSSLQFHY